jgi:hypothetical protein
LLRIFPHPIARPTASRKSSAEISVEPTSTVTARPDSPRRVTRIVFHPGRANPAFASAVVKSAKEIFVAHSRAPSLVQYGSARETIHGIAACDPGQASAGLAVLPPQFWLNHAVARRP